MVDWLEVGGGQRHLLALTRGLSGQGYRFVIATSGDEPMARAFEEAGAAVVSLVERPVKHRFSPLFVARLVAMADAERFDLIHAHLHSAATAGAVASRVRGIPLVITRHSMSTWQTRRHRALARWADRQADVVIAVASNVAAAHRRAGIEPLVIPNGVAVPGRLWLPHEVAAARAALGVPIGAYVVAFVGRLAEEKNPALFVEVAARMAADCPEAHFLALGDGPLRPALEGQVNRLGLRSRFNFAGFRPNAAELMQAIDVLVLTSASEGAPLVVLEAMAAGKPVIATAAGDVPLQIADGETGFVVDRNEVDVLAERVKHLAAPEGRERLGSAARRRALQHFSLDVMLHRTAEVYDSLVVSL